MDKMRSIWIWFELDKNASVLHGLQLFECCRRWKWTWRKCTISRDSAAPKAKYFIVAWELLTDNRSVSNFTIRTHWNKICEACFVFEKELKKVQPKTCPTFCTSIHEKQLTINKPNIVFAAISCYFIEQATHYHTELKKSTKVCKIFNKSNLKGELLHSTLFPVLKTCTLTRVRICEIITADLSDRTFTTVSLYLKFQNRAMADNVLNKMHHKLI